MKFAVVTFGCRVNQADSLRIEGELLARGGTHAAPEDADLVVVNTCSVTATADQGARQTIRRIARENPRAKIVATGCYATRCEDDVAALPGVDRLKALAGDLRRGVIRIPAAGIRAEMVRTEGLSSLALAVRDDGLRIEADRAALVDAIVILASNAAIAVAGAGRVTIAADAARITVSDTGPGVPAAIAARLFQPFVTGRGRDHAHPGTGLGLAIARSIAERHGGTLHHERPPDGGARFVLRWSGVDPR